MEKKNVIIILSALLIIIIGMKFYLSYDFTNIPEDNDIIKFKQEYESLNNTKSEDNKDYLTLNIKEDNKILYKTGDEIIDILENKTGVIYFGFNTCPWCRNIITPLLNSAKNNNIKNLYYVDIKDIRSSYKVEDNKLTKEVLGTKSYYKILELLDKYLEPLILTENDEQYDTKEKRLYAPTVVVVKEGEILDLHSGSIDNQEDPYKSLNEIEQKELESIYNKMFMKLTKE